MLYKADKFGLFKAIKYYSEQVWEHPFGTIWQS